MMARYKWYEDSKLALAYQAAEAQGDVTSVNGHTGAVTLTNTDVGADAAGAAAAAQSAAITAATTAAESYTDTKLAAAYGATAGPILTDTADGHTYRLTSTNGALVLTQVT